MIRVPTILIAVLIALQPGLLQAQSDSSVVSLSTYLEWVQENHPLWKQSRLLPGQARAELMQARGQFDPAIYGSHDTKEFKSTNYYTHQEIGVKAPVWSGIEFKAGWENNDGQFLNPEGTVPDDGLFFAGVSIPVGRGLVVDERRAAIQVGLLAIDISEAERLKWGNKILADAAKTWWIWWESAQRVRLLEEAVELAQFRYDATVISISNGDKPAIDSVEAGLEIWKREAALQEGRLAFENARTFASAYLWDADGNPVNLSLETSPGDAGDIFNPPTSGEANNLSEWSQENHPELLKLNLKQLQIGKQSFLAKQNLLPEVRLDFFPLASTPQRNDISLANYKFGVQVYMPLFLRKERGKLEALRIKSEQNQLELQQQSRQIRATMEASQQQYARLGQIIELQEKTVVASALMREAEVTRMRAGESSLFLVNRRERSWIDARLKLISYQAKEAKALIGYYLDSGTDLAARVNGTEND